MAGHSEHDATAESERIISGVNAEGGTVLGSSLSRAANHVAATDIDPSDKIEVWGTRIGRTLALALTFVALVWALVWLFSN